MTHVPVPMKLTCAPEIEHTLVAEASIVNVTGRPEGLAVAVTVYAGSATLGLTGGVDVKLIVWSPLATANDCCACVAAFQFALPAWLASTTQVPTAVKETTFPAIEQMLVAVASIENVTGRPDGLAVALTV